MVTSSALKLTCFHFKNSTRLDHRAPVSSAAMEGPAIEVRQRIEQGVLVPLKHLVDHSHKPERQRSHQR